MRIILPIAGAIILALTGCGGGTETSSAPQTKEEVAAAMQSSAKLKPGEYELLVTVSKVDIPGMPAALTDKMMKEMGPPQKSSYCLTPEKADEGVKAMLSEMNGNCTYSNFKANGATVQGQTACTSPDGTTMTAMLNGRMTAETSDIVMQVEMANKMMPKGKMSILSTSAMKRTGDCVKS